MRNIHFRWTKLHHIDVCISIQTSIWCSFVVVLLGISEERGYLQIRFNALRPKIKESNKYFLHIPIMYRTATWRTLTPELKSVVQRRVSAHIYKVIYFTLWLWKYVLTTCLSLWLHLWLLHHIPSAAMSS